MADASIAFGPFTLDRSQRTLLRAGKPVAVGQRGLALLDALAAADGAVTKAALMEAGWPGTVVEEGNLTVQIAALRKALGQRPDGQEWIVTVPRVGYRLLRGGAPKVEATQLPSLAVLPFQNLSDDPGQEYFADGMVEDIITALSRYKSIGVVARNSSSIYKGQRVDVRQAARELDVGYVLEGSVRRSGERLRITAQLVDGRSGTHLWAHNFDGSFADIFDFQDRITESVAAVIEPQISQAEIERTRRERPENPAAHDLYLQALQKHETKRPEGNFEALQLLDRALALDPNHVPAMALAAHELEHRLTMGWPPYGPDDRGRSLALARRALEDAADDAAVLARCGIVLVQVAREYDRGLAVLERAFAVNPNDAVVVQHLAVAHLLGGDLERAEYLYRRDIKMSLRESGDLAMAGLGFVEMVRGNYEAALEWAGLSLSRYPNFNPSHWILIAANAYLGRMDEARRRLAIFTALFPSVTLANIMGGDRHMTTNRLHVVLDGLQLAGLPDGKES